jgi:hypothetical protein
MVMPNKKTEVIESIQDEFASPKFVDENVKPPYIQALRGTTPDNCGYFISLEQMLKADWIDIDSVQEQIITYTFESSGQQELGLLINKPRMLVCPKTPLLAYSRSASNKAKEKVIVGTYKQQYKEDKDISVCKTYKVILLDRNNKLLHQVPFEYSAKGATQATFGQHWNTLVQEVSNCHATANKIPTLPKNNQFNCLCVFSFKVERQLVGQEQKSFTCRIVEHSQPTNENWKNYFVGYDSQLKEQIWEKLKPQELLIVPSCTLTND